MFDSQIAESQIGQILVEINHGISDPAKRLVLDTARLDALCNYHDVQACPGSGKTTLVGIKLLLLARNWREQHSGLCVLTHSNVAKEEILKVLRRHPAGHRLVSYPHFIGTIQDFVNTFLGLPYARGRGWQVRLFARQDYSEKLSSSPRLSKKVHDKQHDKKYRLRYYIKNDRINLGDLFVVHDSDKLTLCPTFVKSIMKHIDVTKSNDVIAHFRELRKEWCERGVFQYSEMYAFAKQLVCDIPLTREALRYRFPIVLIDEMQDTQRYQDDLINLVFQSENCRVQRFGDPDQSIFDGIGGEEPNISYNGAVLTPIVLSHRFTPDIASKISRLSYSKISAIAASSPALAGAPPSSIIVFDNESIERVLDRFAELVIELPSDCRKTVRAIGAVAESETSPLTIKKYWPDFQKVGPLGLQKPARLFELVKGCSESGSGHVLSMYQNLIDSVLELLHLSGKMTVNKAGKSVLFSANSLRTFLRDNGQEQAFRELLAEWIMRPCPTKEQWALDVDKLMRCLDLCGSVHEYLAFAEGVGGLAPRPARRWNIRQCTNGINVEVSTIHGAKGETHDATLVLETRFHLPDLEQMLPFLCDPYLQRPKYDPAHPETHESLRASFMKKIYVAASRPRYMLCLAIHRDHLAQNHQDSLRNEGWSIVRL